MTLEGHKVILFISYPFLLNLQPFFLLTESIMETAAGCVFFTAVKNMETHNEQWQTLSMSCTNVCLPESN